MERLKKKQADSKIEVRHIVMPNHLNQNDTLFGGQLLSWIDTCACMTAQKHSGNIVATVQLDSVSFKRPIFKGEHVVLNSIMISVGTTSMTIKVFAYKENPFNNQRELATEAFLVFVALDKDNKPIEVPLIEI
jgi:acyl-CoA hydrolase